MLAKITLFLVGLGPWGILLVSFIDSVGIPLTVGLDFLVILLSAKQPNLAPWWVVLAVIGSSAGNLVLFEGSRKGGKRLLKEEPLVGHPRRFRRWFNRYGLVTVFIPALIPIPMPMKVFVICSGVLGIRRVYFLGAVLLARILRYGGEAYLGAQMGEHSTQYLSEHARPLMAIAAALFVALYTLIRLTDHWRKPAHPKPH